MVSSILITVSFAYRWLIRLTSVLAVLRLDANKAALVYKEQQGAVEKRKLSRVVFTTAKFAYPQKITRGSHACIYGRCRDIGD
jgi:hypothetical protein